MIPQEKQIIEDLLQEMKEKSVRCLKNNEFSHLLFDEVLRTSNDSCQSTESFSLFDAKNNKHNNGKDAVSSRLSETFEPLENILHEKLQENARLKALNERLLIDSRQKSDKIKDLTRSESQKNQQVQYAKEISRFRDKIGRLNVEIQKLKKQLNLENKKLKNEKLKVSKLETVSKINQDKQIKHNNMPPSKNLKRCDQKRKIPSTTENLNEVYQQKALRMISLEEASIFDETLDAPENLDFDSDEVISEELSKESSDVDI